MLISTVFGELDSSLPTYKQQIQLTTQHEETKEHIEAAAKPNWRKKRWLDTRSTKSSDSITWPKFDPAKVADLTAAKGLKIMGITIGNPGLITWESMTWCQNLKKIKAN